MNLNPHNNLQCELYRRQLLQHGATEEWANTQASILGQCYEARQSAKSMQHTYDRRVMILKATIASERRWCRGAIALAAVSGWVLGVAIGLAAGVVL